MTFITVQLGQCGNQIGHSFFSAVAKDGLQNTGSSDSKESLLYQNEIVDRFFHRHDSGKTYSPKAVLIDMEPKVIQEAVRGSHQSEMWSYRDKQAFSQKAGSGNNWAYGYSVYGTRCSDEISNLIRTQVEQCDRFEGFLCLMSLAGGTGSGLGTYVTTLLRDEYQKSFLFNQVVSAYRSGEVIIQSYNSLLTLAHLYQISDGLLILENDSLQQICQKLLSIKDVSFKHLNKIISYKMSSLLLPAHNHKLPNTLGAYMDSLFSQPQYKLSSLLTLPLMSDESVKYSTFSFPPIINTLNQMLITKSHLEEGMNWRMKVRPQSDYNRSVSNILVLRGSDSNLQDITPLCNSDMYPAWLPSNHRVKKFTSTRAHLGREKTASLLTNSQISLGCIDWIVDRAWNMFSSRAYLHQYSKHGIDKENFLDCFYILEKVLSDYKELGGHSEF